MIDKIIEKQEKSDPERSYLLDNRSLFSITEFETLIAISKGVFLERDDNPLFSSKEIDTRVVSIASTVDHLTKISRLEKNKHLIDGLKSLSRIHFTHKNLSDDYFIVCYRCICNLEIKNDGTVVFDMPSPMYVDVLEICLFLSKRFFTYKF